MIDPESTEQDHEIPEAPDDGPSDDLLEQWALEAPPDEYWRQEEAHAYPPPPVDPRWNPRSFAESFEAEFQSIEWLCEDLEIGPGRPSGILGADGAGKSDLAQSLALGVAAGRTIYGRFKCRAGRVAHLTYDMGARAVELRYRRLANGLGIVPEELAGQLVILAHPAINLSLKGALDAYAELFKGFDLAIVDNIREAVPGVDENDSKFGQFITILGRAGVLGKCVPVYLHHSSKDGMNPIRGSSSIGAASGALWHITGVRGEQRTVKHVRLHDMSTGAKPSFKIVREERPRNPQDAFHTGPYSSIVYRAADAQQANVPKRGGKVEERIEADIMAAYYGGARTWEAIRDAVKGGNTAKHRIYKDLVARGAVRPIAGQSDEKDSEEDTPLRDTGYEPN